VNLATSESRGAAIGDAKERRASQAGAEIDTQTEVAVAALGRSEYMLLTAMATDGRFFADRSGPLWTEDGQLISWEAYGELGSEERGTDSLTDQVLRILDEADFQDQYKGSFQEYYK
jgi:hypothetical protein